MGWRPASLKSNIASRRWPRTAPVQDSMPCASGPRRARDAVMRRTAASAPAGKGEPTHPAIPHIVRGTLEEQVDGHFANSKLCSRVPYCRACPLPPTAPLEPSRRPQTTPACLLSHLRKQLELPSRGGKVLLQN